MSGKNCDGFSIISQYILIEDEDDKAEFRDMFNDARDEVWESYNSDSLAFGDYETIFNDVLGNGGSTRQFAKYFGFSVYNNKEAEQLEVYVTIKD